MKEQFCQPVKIKMSLLKEIGILEHFIAKKSQKIAKIEKMCSKRHLAIFRNFLNFYGTFKVDFGHVIP